MGSLSQILLMIIIIIFMLLSLNSNSTYNAGALSNAYAPENFNGHHGLQQLYYYMVEKEDGIQNQIEKVSGEDENDEEHKGSLVEKFRVLLGLRSFHMKRPSNGDYGYVSPAPSPSPSSEVEAPAPAPAPASHVHVHPHPRKHGFGPTPPTYKIQRDDGDKAKVKRILIAVLVSTGAATLVCVVGLIWAYKKYRKDQKKPKRRISVIGKRKGRSKCVTFKKSANKVSLNPGLDLFYLDSLGKDLEQQPEPSSCLMQISETFNTSPNHRIPNDATLPEREVSVHEPIKPEYDNISSSSTREIMSVHEDADSINQEYDCLASPSGVKIVPMESHSSDDEESFHSFGDSNSSNVIRLSNASVGSFSDALENFNPNEWNKSSLLSPPVNLAMQPSTQAQNSSPAQDLKSQSEGEPDKLPIETSSPICQKSFKAPPPPPPPPLPPPRANFLPSRSSSCSIRVESKASGSSTLPNLSSPKESDSLPGSNKTMQVDDLASSPGNTSRPSTSSSGIPPPPCPPPFFKANNKFSKAPPPPPSLFPQFSALGKDGTPLPKLKPLHWDKVRAAPDGSMVWDKLRSSSFE